MMGYWDQRMRRLFKPALPGQVRGSGCWRMSLGAGSKAFARLAIPFNKVGEIYVYTYKAKRVFRFSLASLATLASAPPGRRSR